MKMTNTMQAALYWNRRRRMSLVLTPETSSLISRFVTPPSQKRLDTISRTITKLRDYGLWPKLDCLYLTAAADSQAEKLNWKSNSFNLTEIGTTTFTPDRGFAGDGVASYMRTGFIPSSAGGAYTLNSGHLSVWCRNDIQSDNYSIAGTDVNGRFSGIIPRRVSSGAVLGVINMNTTSGASVGVAPTSAGFTHVNRSAVDLTTVYKNGVQLATHAVVSNGLPTVELYLGARNGNGVAAQFDTRQIAAATIGGSLDATESLNLYNIIAEYMADVGA